MKSHSSKLYRYVGPLEISRRFEGRSSVQPIRSLSELVEQLFQLGLRQCPNEPLTATFVIDADGWLRIADRRSEHVACAGGGEVYSAGELTFVWNLAAVYVAGASNQSTGYCPEPSSWSSVQAALEGIGVGHTDGFNPALEFRRCPSCRQTNIVKDAWLFCEACGADLPVQWNCLPYTQETDSISDEAR